MEKRRHIIIIFRIPGNQENIKGNPLGFVHLTQKSLWNEKSKRFQEWKDYVWNCLLKAEPKPPRFAGIKISINCYIFYSNKDHRRADPGNVVKGIADALADISKNPWEQRLYPDDRCVLERCQDYDYSENPGVLVVISEVS